jgi:hypothetical protein
MILCIIYIIWLTFYIGYDIRVYAERLSTSAMTDMNIFMIIVPMLLIIGYVLKSGISILGKMSEIFILILSAIFIVYNFMVLSELDVSKLFPITYKDIPYIFRASFAELSLFGSSTFLLFINDKIDNKGEFKKLGVKLVILMSIIFVIVIVLCVGVHGWSIISNMSFPYINTVAQISLFSVVEKIELGIVIFWIIADFIMIAVGIYSVLNIFKVMFKLQSINPIINIYLVITLFLSIIIARTSLELQICSELILTPANILIGYLSPIIVYIIGRIRKKI